MGFRVYSKIAVALGGVKTDQVVGIVQIQLKCLYGFNVESTVIKQMRLGVAVNHQTTFVVLVDKKGV